MKRRGLPSAKAGRRCWASARARARRRPRRAGDARAMLTPPARYGAAIRAGGAAMRAARCPPRRARALCCYEEEGGAAREQRFCAASPHGSAYEAPRRFCRRERPPARRARPCAERLPAASAAGGAGALHAPPCIHDAAGTGARCRTRRWRRYRWPRGHARAACPAPASSAPRRRGASEKARAARGL